MHQVGGCSSGFQRGVALQPGRHVVLQPGRWLQRSKKGMLCTLQTLQATSGYLKNRGVPSPRHAQCVIYKQAFTSIFRGFRGLLESFFRGFMGLLGFFGLILNLQ